MSLFLCDAEGQGGRRWMGLFLFCAISREDIAAHPSIGCSPSVHWLQPIRPLAAAAPSRARSITGSSGTSLPRPRPPRQAPLGP